MKRLTLLFVMLLATVCFAAAADEDGTLMIFADYNIPINPPAEREIGGGDSSISPSDYPPASAESLSVGAAYKFWGIFFVGGHFYNEIIYGADNLFNIDEVRPIGLFSAGLGVEIPLGGIGFIFDWQRMFTGTSAREGIFDFSNSFKWGLTFEVSERFALEAYTRRFSNFSGQAQDEYRIYADEHPVNTFGAGAILRLF
jgi:hypothetical protein